MFQCLLNVVLRDMLGKFVIAYIDIHSSSFESHVSHIKQVLSLLLSNQLDVKGEKCELHAPQSHLWGISLDRNE